MLIILFILQKKITGKDKQFDAPTKFVCVATEKEGRRSATIIPEEGIKRIRKIGEGAHGAVCEGTWADEHGSVSGTLNVSLAQS